MGAPIEFTSGEATIKGKLYSASTTPPHATVLLLPGFPGNEADVMSLGQGLSETGSTVLMFNYRGTHRSGGAFSFRGTIEDIQSAIEYLHGDAVQSEHNIDPSRLVIGGHSYGGGMALAYAVRHSNIDRIFSIAGTDHGEFLRTYKREPGFRSMIDTEFGTLGSPEGPVEFAPGYDSPVDEIDQDPFPYDLRRHAAVLSDRDILLIGGWNDPYVTIEAHVLPLYRSLTDTDAEHVRLEVFQDNHDFGATRTELKDTIDSWLKPPARN